MDSSQATDLPFRIACYGYAEPAAGSVSSAGYVILREMLRRGHAIDFFGKPSFAYPSGLERFPNFRFVNTEGKAERALARASGLGPGLWRTATGFLTADQTMRNVPAAMRREHTTRRYAVQLYLGTWSFGRIAHVPSVSWIQGPPGTDSRSIYRHRDQLIRLNGWRRYATLRTFAGYRNTIGQPPYRHTDVVIVGSEWSARTLRPYVAENVAIERLPYPVDLEEFRPSTADEPQERAAPQEILWLGRSVPRKRLDLFLAACERLIESGRQVKVRGVGGFGFAPGYQRLVSEFRYPQRRQWSTGMPRAQVPALLRQATVLVQPSEEENFGSSVAEALACGTPVVLGPTNGTGDYIADAGARFTQYEAGSVAAAIATVLDGVAAEPAQWRSRCRGVAMASFSVERVVDQLDRILHSAVASARSRPPSTRAGVPKSRAETPAADSNGALKTMQLGGGWLPEQSGGLNRYYFELLHHMPKAGVYCQGLVAGDSAGWPADPAVAVRAFAPLKASLLKRWISLRRMLAAALAAERFDLTVTHFAPYAVAALKQMGAHGPMVVHFHGPWARESQEEGAGALTCAAKRAIERRVYGRADRLIVLSQAFKEVLVEDYDLSPERVKVVPGGVDCKRFNVNVSRLAARQELGWPANRPILLTVRRLVRRMGLENLIAAVDRVRARHPDLLLMIAGAGPLQARLEATIAALGLSDHIRLLGFLPDAQLPLAYRASDLSVVPSTALEGFGLVAVESLAAGTPVLVTPVGGLPEVVNKLDKGLIFADATVHAMEERLAAVLDNPSILPAAADCRRYACTHFDWSKIAMQLKDCYAEVLA